VRSNDSQNTRRKIKESPTGNPAVSEWAKYLILAVAIAITYSPSLMLGWIWDDDQYVTLNPLLNDASGLTKIWFDPSATPQYYPIVFSVFWSLKQIFGLEPAVFHAVNCFVHMLVAACCMRILSQLKLPAAFWIALAFGVHPIHVESVAWVTELKNVSSGLFYGLAWLALWPLLSRDAENAISITDQRRWFALGCASFLAALLCKSVTATLPAAMLVALWYVRGTLRWRDLGLMLPLFCVGALSGWNTARLEVQHVGALGADWEYGTLERFGIAAKCCLHYFANLVLPLEQIFFYPRFSVVFDGNAGIALSVCVAILILFTGLAYRGQRGPLAGLLFFTGSALPALGFLNVYPHRFSFVADHFVYLSSIGVLAITITALYRATELLAHRVGGLKQYHLPSFVLTGLICWYSLQTLRYVPVFSTQETLWTDVLKKNPACWAAMQNLGLLYVEEQRAAEAVPLLEAALAFDFDRFQTYNSLGIAYQKLGRGDEAEEAFRTSLELKPTNANASINLASVVRQRATLDNRELLTEARSLYARAFELRPEHRSAFSAGTVSFEIGDFVQAKLWFERAIAYSRDLDSLYNLAVAQQRTGEFESAIETCKRILLDFPKDDAAQKLLQELQSQSSAHEHETLYRNGATQWVTVRSSRAV
jgi:protein O-mannosyl-transferase